MQRDDQPRSITLRPRAFVPCAGALNVHSGGGLAGRRAPISLAACSYKP
jgi:hypothetical protein